MCCHVHGQVRRTDESQNEEDLFEFFNEDLPKTSASSNGTEILFLLFSRFIYLPIKYIDLQTQLLMGIFKIT